jgi:ATP-dependent DNA ligase
MPARTKAGFVEPMLLLRTDRLPDDPARWAYQLKLDGYRAVAFKVGGEVHLRSRNDKDFNARYPAVVRGLAKLPSDTVIDGELIALGDDGRPSFNALQNYGSASTPILYFVFDVMVFEGRDVKTETLDSRRELLEQRIVPKLAEPVRYVGTLDANLRDLVHSVKAQGLEGLVAKRRDSRYEAGLRSGAWMKMRINQGQEFVIGGYTVGTKTFDALIFGYYEGESTDLRGAHAERLHLGSAGAIVQEVPSARNRRMSVRESARSEKWSMGPGLDEGKDGRLPVAEASAGRTVRVPGMDGRQSPPAHEIHGPA